MSKKLLVLVLMTLPLMIAEVQASLILDVEGINGSGVTTWTLTGSSTVNQDGQIRTSVGSANFSIDDTFEPDVTGNFLSNSSIQNQLFAISGSPTITVGSDTRTITHIFLDEDGSSRDDWGIRTDTVLDYLSREASSWLGTFTVNLDINNFILGSYRLNTAQSNGGGFLFAAVDDVILNFSEVPEPATLALFGIGLAGLGFARKKKKSA